LHEVPALVIVCIEGRVEKEAQVRQASLYGSILPAAWSFMLALRARGVGSAWTTLHLIHEKDAAKVLGIPDTVTQAVLMPVAYYKGTDFKPAKRLPARDRTHWNTWGQRR
jgi:nitroreductase